MGGHCKIIAIIPVTPLAQSMADYRGDNHGALQVKLSQQPCGKGQTHLSTSHCHLRITRGKNLHVHVCPDRSESMWMAMDTPTHCVCGWLWTVPLTVIQGKSLPCQPFFLKFSIWTWPTFRLSRLFNEKICYKLLNKVSGTSKCSISGILLLSLLLLVSSVILHTKKLSHKNLEETLVARQWVFPNHTLRTTGKTTVMQRFCVKQLLPQWLHFPSHLPSLLALKYYFSLRK